MAAILRSDTKPNERVLVFPEGVMLNYLARRETSVPYTNFMPPEVLFFGEENMLAALRKEPPEWIVEAPKKMIDYRVQIGDDFLKEMSRWIAENYQVERQVHGSGDYTMTLLRRRP